VVRVQKIEEAKKNLTRLNKNDNDINAQKYDIAHTNY
jgi:hypothetical protein